MGRRGSNRVRLRSDGGLGTGEVGSGGDLEPAKVRGVACPSPGFLRCREHGEAPGRACPLLGPGSHRNVELEERSQGRRKRKELEIHIKNVKNLQKMLLSGNKPSSNDYTYATFEG